MAASEERAGFPGSTRFQFRVSNVYVRDVAIGHSFINWPREFNMAPAKATRWQRQGGSHLRCQRAKKKKLGFRGRYSSSPESVMFTWTMSALATHQLASRT